MKGVGESIYSGFTHNPHHLILDSVSSVYVLHVVLGGSGFGTFNLAVPESESRETSVE